MRSWREVSDTPRQFLLYCSRPAKVGYPPAAAAAKRTRRLTIKGVRQIGEKRKFQRAFPNYEVTDSFLSSLAPIYAGLGQTESTNCQFAAQEALLDGDVSRLVKVLKSFFANLPYNLTDRQNEQMWQTIVYVVLKAIGAAVRAKVLTNDGRIDMTCETPSGIWLIEFKLDRPAEEALAQIDRNEYAAKFDFAGKKVVSWVNWTVIGQCMEEGTARRFTEWNGRRSSVPAPNGQDARSTCGAAR